LEDNREETEKENRADARQGKITPKPLPSCKKGGFFS
jgi:hypothetical protein